MSALRRACSRSILTLLLTVLLCVPVVYGQARDPGIFVYAGYFDIPTLDPHNTESSTAECVLLAIYEKLVRFAVGTGEIEPGLATKWEVSEDGKSYTFHLRQGVSFTDGAPFNAEAVKVNFDRVFGVAGPVAARLVGIKSVEVVDEYTIRISLEFPSPVLLQDLAAHTSPDMVSPKALAEHKTADDPWAMTWFATHCVGTGPYMLSEYVAKDRAVLTRNENYWGGWAGKHFSTIIRRTVPEYTTRRTLLETGQADLIDFPEAEDIDNLAKAKGVKVVYLDTINPVWWTFNFFSPTMHSKALREALSWSFPYQEAMAIAGFGSVQLQGPLPASVPGHNDNLPIYQTDLDKARQKLSEAGYKPGDLKLGVAYYQAEPFRRSLEVWQSNLEEIGVRLELLPMVWGQFSPWRSSGPKLQGEIFLSDPWPDYPDPWACMGTFFLNTPDRRPPFQNGYYNEEVNSLLLRAQSTIDKEQRLAPYRQVQDILVNDVVAVWGFQVNGAVAISDSVENFIYNSAYFQIFDFYKMSRK